jgi:hypothetical protein
VKISIPAEVEVTALCTGGGQWQGFAIILAESSNNEECSGKSQRP